MSNVKAEELVREFHYNGIRIPDPGPELSVEQVRDLLTPQFPEIATASRCLFSRGRRTRHDSAAVSCRGL